MYSMYSMYSFTEARDKSLPVRGRKSKVQEISKPLRNKNLSEFLRTIHPYTLYTPLKLTSFDKLPTFGNI